MTDRRLRTDPVGEAVRGLLRAAAGRRAPVDPQADVPTRLAALEREVQEVRTRIHALFFAVLTAGLGELAGRVVLG